MKFYTLKLDRPKWFSDPVTNGQLKVLKFFNVQIKPSLNKGKASGIIGRLFSEKSNKELWGKYVYITGDEVHDTAELKSFDMQELETVEIPKDWSPNTSSQKKRLESLIADILRDGTPFDDPVPSVIFEKKSFCFTGKFITGTRQECNDAVSELGSIPQSNVTTSTDYLIIGNEANSSWAHSNYGRKIERAMMLRMDNGKPLIISEADWVSVIQQQKEKS